MSTPTYIVFIGRFQPFHNGHLAVAKAAFEYGDHLLFVAGSIQEPRTSKNPFNFDERRTMIHQAMLEAQIDSGRFAVGGALNYSDDARWCAGVKEEVARLIRARGDDPEQVQVRLIGRDKDASSYYLSLFPEWGRPIHVARTEILGATELRAHYFRNDRGSDLLLEANVPSAVKDILVAFRYTPAYRALQAEHRAIENYKKGPYGPGPHLTTDAVVTCHDHVLLIERGRAPGAGLLALPGGFLERDESLLNCALRELSEETGLQVPKTVLRQSVRASKVWDAPSRDPRGRIVTQSFGFVLSDSNQSELPAINPKGGDDARKAEWFPLSEVLAMRERLFLDHFSIIEYHTVLSDRV